MKRLNYWLIFLSKLIKGEDQSKNTHFKRSTRGWYKQFNEVSKGNLNKLYYSQEPFNKKEIQK